MNPNCYYHSGKLPLTGMLITLLVGSIAAACLGIVYSCCVVFIGIIYLNFLIAMGYGFGISAAVTWSAKIGHVRSKIFPASAAVVVALVGLYFAWAADMVTRFKLPLTDGKFLIALHPSVMAKYVQYFYEHGLWTITNHGMKDPAAKPVHGIFLAAIWLAEAGIIAGVAAMLSWKSMANLIYCERCDKWAKQEKDVRRLRLALSQADFGRVANGDLAPLATLPRASKSEPNFLRLDLAQCDGCTESNFLTLNRVMTVVNKKGNKTQQVTPLVRALAINPEEVALVREAGVEPTPPAFQPPAPVAADALPAADAEPPVKQPWE